MWDLFRSQVFVRKQQLWVITHHGHISTSAVIAPDGILMEKFRTPKICGQPGASIPIAFIFMECVVYLPCLKETLFIWIFYSYVDDYLVLGSDT